MSQEKPPSTSGALLAPSHVVAATIFTAGLAGLYWQNHVARKLGIAHGYGSMLLRTLPVVGPVYLASDIELAPMVDPSSRARQRWNLYVLAILEVVAIVVIACAIKARAIASEHLDSTAPLLLSAWHYVTYGWYLSVLVLLSALGTFFMSDVQWSLSKLVGVTTWTKHPGSSRFDPNLHRHFWLNVAAAAGAILIPTILLQPAAPLWLLVAAVLIGCCAYVNGFRQRFGHGVHMLLSPSLWVQASARHGGLLAATILIIVSAFIWHDLFGRDDSTERGIQVGVLVNPSFLHRTRLRGQYDEFAREICDVSLLACTDHDLPVMIPSFTGQRLHLTFHVPLAMPAPFTILLTKFVRTRDANGKLSPPHMVDHAPICRQAVNGSQIMPVFFSGNESSFTYLIDAKPDRADATTIDCSFADRSEDVVQSSYTRRHAVFALLHPEDTVLPPDVPPRSDIRIDLRGLVSADDITVFGGMVDQRTAFEPRVRVVSATPAVALPAEFGVDRELAVDWTERGSQEQRELLLIVTGSLLGLALVCLLEWMRPHVLKLAKYDIRSDLGPPAPEP